MQIICLERVRVRVDQSIHPFIEVGAILLVKVEISPPLDIEDITVDGWRPCVPRHHIIMHPI